MFKLFYIRTLFDKDPRLGRYSTSTNDDKIDEVRAMISENCRLTAPKDYSGSEHQRRIMPRNCNRKV